MKLTRHNGRSGKHGTYNPKHNDRSFHIYNSEHINPEMVQHNIYWDCFNGYHSNEDISIDSFEKIEQHYYDLHYSAYVESQNERNLKNRHPERNRTTKDLLVNKKTCPEETIFQIGTLDNHVPHQLLIQIVTEFMNEIDSLFGKYVHTLNWALHLDESTPHIHERHVFDCENRYGEICPQQEKALEKLGFDLPNPDKPPGKNNHRKMTFDSVCRVLLFEICKKHGLELEEEPEYGGRAYLEKQDYILAKQKEQLAAQEQKLNDLTLKIEDIESLVNEVSDIAYEKAVEAITTTVCEETYAENIQIIEDAKNWLLSDERKGFQKERSYAAKFLDTLSSKLRNALQYTIVKTLSKLSNPEIKKTISEQIKSKAKASVLELLNNKKKQCPQENGFVQRTAKATKKEPSH